MTADTVFEPGDAPCVRDLLLEHFRDADLEVEGKLGHSSSKGRFRAGVTEEQFVALEAELATRGASFLRLPPCSGLPRCDTTVDRFYASPAPVVEEDGLPPQRRRATNECRLSFACDSAGHPRDEPFEVLRKARLSDCHVASASSVGLRVSFSRETAVPRGVAAAEGAVLVNERRKRRRTWEAPLWQVALTRVSSKHREAFEVEVELRMDVVRPRLESAACPGEEALCITRELVAALRGLTALAAGVQAGQKRRRVESLRAAEPELRLAVDRPEVAAELSRFMRQGREALHEAKQYLCDVLRDRCPSADEAAVFRFAGQQVARALLRQRSAPGPPQAEGAPSA